MIRRTVVALGVVGTIFGSSVIIRDYSIVKYNGKESLEGKTVVITGANTGLGKEASLQLAKRNANVIMTCRDLEKCLRSRVDVVSRSGNKNVKCSQLDLASLQSVKDFVNRLKKSAQFASKIYSHSKFAEEKHVHILVNNAGVMRCPKTITEDGFEMQLGVNHLGHFLLTNLLLDLLKNSTPSRIVNVSSSAHFRGSINFDDINSEKSYNASEAYSQSKLANVLFTRELAKRLKGSGVYVYAVHPGVVNTDIGRHMSYSNSILSSVFVKPFLWLFTLSTRQGVQTILHCALSKELENDECSGKYFSNCKEREPSPEAKNDVTARKLWLLSEKWTRISIAC